MAQPPLIVTPFATNGDQSVLPATDANGFVNFNQGYTPDYELNLASGDPQAKAVERGIQNYLFGALTTGMMAWQNQNRPGWYSTMPNGYNKWAEVMYPTDGSATPQPYRSLVNNNVATPGNSSNWEYIEGTAEMIANVPMPSGGSSGPGSMLISTATNFNSFTTSGTWQFQSDSIVSGSANAPTNGGNVGVAGMLEVTSWVNGANTYVTQFYRDRNGLGFMRAATNGSWTVWKIWASANQFTIGEIRIWSGTATEAAVQAAWGAGWHLCNGANGTPDLRDKFILGAGNVATGTTGGSTSVTLSAANIPAHTHTITISDPGHNHAVSDPGHSHGVNDPGHAHGVYDPGHAHSNKAGGWCQAGQDNGGAGALSPANQYGTYTGSINATNASGTGISIYGNGTGIYLSASATGVSIAAKATGITATASSYGSGSAFTVQPPYAAMAFVMYTGA